MSPLLATRAGDSAQGYGFFGAVAVPSSFESIATANASSSTISFTSIPQTYKSLQIRGIAKSDTSSAYGDYLKITFNGDTGTNYISHWTYFAGAPYVGAIGQTALPSFQTQTGAVTSNSSLTGMYGVSVIDIIDYSVSTKNKTVKVLAGGDINNSAQDAIELTSGLWLNTAAITSIAIQTGRTSTFTGSFALYGIKG
jgi:hypothetical protein